MLAERMSESIQDKVAVSSDQRAMRVPRKRIRELIAFVAHAEEAEIEEVDVAVVTGRKIASLNRRWLGHRGETDVITFDLAERGEPAHAQIVVCADIAVREGERQGHGAQRELLLYVAHGLLHLLGHDDARPADARRMHARQEQLLAEFLERH